MAGMIKWILILQSMAMVHSQCTTEFCQQPKVDPVLILESHLGYLRDRVNTLTSRLDSAVKQMENMRETITNQDQTTTTQGQTISELRETITNQDQTITTQGQTIIELRDTIADQSNKIANLENKQTTVRAFTARMADGYYRPTTRDPVPFTDVTVNIGGDYNPETSTFTCSVAGYYWFSLSIHSADLNRGTSYYLSAAVLTHRSSTGTQTAVARVYSHNQDSVDMYVQGSTSAVIQCMAGDTVWVRPYFTGSNQMYGHPYDQRTVFAGFLITTV